MSVKAKNSGAAIGHSAVPDMNDDYTHAMFISPNEDLGGTTLLHEIIETINGTTLFGDAHDFLAIDTSGSGPVLEVLNQNNAGDNSDLPGFDDDELVTDDWYYVAITRRGNSLEAWKGPADGVTAPEIVATTTFASASDLSGRHAAAMLWVGAFSYVSDFAGLLGFSVVGRKLWQAALDAAGHRKESKQKHPVRLDDLWGSWLSKHIDDLTDYSGNGHPWKWANNLNGNLYDGLVETFSGATADSDVVGHVSDSGHSWINHSVQGLNPFKISAAGRAYRSGNNTNFAVSSYQPPSADYAMEADFRRVSSDDSFTGIGIRASATDNVILFARYNNNSQAWELQERNGDVVSLGTFSDTGFAVGATKRVRVEAIGDQVTMSVDGVEILSGTTTITGAGRPAIRSITNSFGESTTGVHLDNINVEEGLIEDDEDPPLIPDGEIGVDPEPPETSSRRPGRSGRLVALKIV